MDREKIEQGVRFILEGLGEDLSREGLQSTPARVAKMYEEIFCGIDKDPTEVIQIMFAEDHNEMVLVKDIPFYSVCEHHLMPFIGRAHVAYIPGENGKITGISKLARVVDVVSKRPQVQERLTTIVADSLVKALNPLGVFVVVEAEHLCMSMRGAQKPGTLTITSAVRGIFLTNDASRQEALSFINRGRG
ncbi:MAG TPA: GTP cyclohydrolase I FolE [Actinobacteria bacterium]|nr:GTP cyclohydrolase I FolE [Actinomycetota bacterium]